MKIEWSLEAKRTTARFIRDQEGMRQLVGAIDLLAKNPEPPEAFIRGEYRRLKVGPYRVMYLVQGHSSRSTASTGSLALTISASAPLPKRVTIMTAPPAA